MKTSELLKKVTDLTLYTGSNGQHKCTCRCPGCTQIKYGNRNDDYQGNIEQVRKIIKYLPNLKNAYLLGNPDTSVDTEFCNKAAREFVKNDINVMFSTSGYDALETVKKLTEEIPADKISYISFSIDSIKKDVLQKLKGTKHINIEDIEEAILYCNKNKIPVKIQPTIWQINQEEYREIMKYFNSRYGIKWYTFHLASFEAIDGKENIILKNVQPSKWVDIRRDIIKIAKEKGLKVSIPKVFLTENENEDYDIKKAYCYNGGAGLQIWLEKDNIKCTFCPIHTETDDKFCFKLEDKEAKLETETNNCVCAPYCISEALKKKSLDEKGYEFNENGNKYYNICRYYSDRVNY